MGASMRLDEEGGGRADAGDMAGGVAPPLPCDARLPAEDSLAGVPARLAPEPEPERASWPEPATLPREEAAEGGRGGRAAEAPGTPTRICTAVELLRAWEGLLGEAGGRVAQGTETM